MRSTGNFPGDKIGTLSLAHPFEVAQLTSGVAQAQFVSFPSSLGGKDASMKFAYQTAKEKIEIDIPEEWNSVLVEMDRKEFNNDRTETRRHSSLDGMVYEGSFFAVSDDAIANITEATEMEIKLAAGMDKLTPGQRRLIQAIFYEGMSGREYAELKGVSPSAITQQKNTALKKLKKFFDEP